MDPMDGKVDRVMALRFTFSHSLLLAFVVWKLLKSY